MAVIGLALALVSAMGQGLLPRPSGFDEWDQWAALVLTALLLVVSAWFAADVRRIRRWSEATTDLRHRLMDLDAQPPGMVLAALATTHEPEVASIRAHDLRSRAAEAAAVLADRTAAPGREQIESLIDATTAALESGPDRHPTTDAWLSGGAELAESWQAVARLRSSARRVLAELDSSPTTVRLAAHTTNNFDTDPRNRWTELVGLATILFGLIAAPAVAENLTDGGGGETGTQQLNQATIESLTIGNQAASEAMSQAMIDLDGSLDDLRTFLAAADDRETAETAIERLTAELDDLATALQPQPSVEIDVVVPVASGNTLWAIAEANCDNDGTAKSVLADVVALWAANIGTVGDDPNVLVEESNLIIACAEE
jgi:hypothetical protein